MSAGGQLGFGWWPIRAFVLVHPLTGILRQFRFAVIPKVSHSHVSGLITTSHFGSSGFRSRRSWNAWNAFLATFAPVSNTFSRTRTMGEIPFQVIVLAQAMVVARSTSSVPFQCPLSNKNGQDAPHPFHRVVFAVIRRVIDQGNFQAVAVGEFHDSLDELRPVARQCGAVVQVDHQFANVAVRRFPLLPPEFQTLDDEVAGFARGAEHDRELAAWDLENPEGNQLLLDAQILVLSLHRLFSTRTAAA